MLPVIIVLAIVTVVVFIAEDQRKFRGKPQERAKRQKRRKTALQKGSSGMDAERLHGKRA